MDEFNKIKKEHFINGKNINQIAIKFNRSWETIDRIIKMPEHLIQLRGTRKKNPSVITEEIYSKIIDLIKFETSNKVPKKQRFTAKAIFNKLKEENNFQGSPRRVRAVVNKIRKELKAEVIRSFLQLQFEIGKYLQLDHGEVEVVIKGVWLKGYLFVAAVPGASIRYCQFYPVKSHESWGDFHEKVFSYLGGVFDYVMYDNDSVLKNNQLDTETMFAKELQEHYGFKAVYCNKASGHEKGAVENSVGYCRRNFLAGIVEFDSFQALNDYLLVKCDGQWGQLHYESKRPLSDYLKEIKLHVRSWVHGKSWGPWMELKVDSQQQILYLGHHYSVPTRYVGSKLKVHVTSGQVKIYDENSLICEHERKYLPQEDSLVLDHYLEQLIKRPRAIAHAKVLKLVDWPSYLLQLWDLLRIRHGEREGNKQFIEVLILKRQCSQSIFETAIPLAISYCALSSDGVKSIIQHLQIDQIRSSDECVRLSESDFNINCYQELQEVSYD